MTFRPRMTLLLSFTLISPAITSTTARAQGQGPYAFREDARYTFSPFLGTRFGGRIDLNTPTVNYLPIDTSLNWGFNFGARILPRLFGEFMWNRQSTTLSAHHVLTNNITTLTNNAHLDMYQLGLLYEIPTGSQLVPFVVGGIGFTHFDSHGVL